MTARDPVVVIGGGVAGLAAAWNLQKSGVRCTLLERRRTTGGRASSFRDPVARCELDTGQHVVLGACTELLSFLRAIGCENAIHWRDRYRLWCDGKVFSMAPSRWLPRSMRFLPAFLQYSPMAPATRAAAIRTLLRVRKLDLAPSSPTGRTLESMTLRQWIEAQRVPAEAVTRFFEPVVAGAVNETPERVSARAALWVIQTGFLSSPENARLGIPAVPLGDWFDRAARTALESRGVAVRCGEEVQRVERREGGGFHIITENATHAARAVVAAVPWHSLPKLLPPDLNSAAAPRRFAGIEASPILGAHYFFDAGVRLPYPELAILERAAHWAFDRYQITGRAEDRGHVAVVTSAAHDLARQPREVIETLLLSTLREVFPHLRGRQPRRCAIVIEWHATFSAAPGVEDLRLAPRVAPGFFVAGDACDTGWPATMEGAVRSGMAAARAVAAEFSGA